MIQSTTSDTMAPLYDRIQQVGSAGDTEFLTQTNHSGNTQANRLRWVELADSPHFAKDAHYYLSTMNYAIIPATREDDGSTIPKVKIKNKYLQEQIADINNKAFNNAYSAFAVVDNNTVKFLFIDLDLHKNGSLTPREACNQLQIDPSVFKQARFQTSLDGRSVHLLFRLDNETLQLFREDQKQADNNRSRCFTTDMKTNHDERIPLNVELKLHPAFGNVRLKPNKRLYLKSRNEFPLITNHLKEIILDIKNRNEQAINEQKEKARQAEIRMQNMSMADLDEDQKGRRNKGAALLKGCLNDIRNCSGGRFQTINDKVLKVGSFAVDGQIDQTSAFELLLEAALSTGYPRKKTITTVKDAWRDGLKNPKRFILKPRRTN